MDIDRSSSELEFSAQQGCGARARPLFQAAGGFPDAVVGARWFAPRARAAVPSSDELHVQVITDADKLERHADAWWDLLSRSDADRVTLSPAWLLPWWRIFGRVGARRLCVCLFWDGNTLIGLAPLLRRWRLGAPGLPFARIELLGTGEREEDEIGSEYVGVIAARGQE